MALTQTEINTYLFDIRTSYSDYGYMISKYQKLGRTDIEYSKLKLRLLKYFVGIIIDYFDRGTSYETKNFFTTAEIYDIVQHINKICNTNYTIPIVTNPYVDIQYIYYDNSQAIYSAGNGTKKIFDDLTTQVRKRVVGNNLYIDITLTATGFSGIENTDWATSIIHSGQNTTWRSGVRSGVFYDDCTITVTGFAGIQDTDWEAIHLAVGAGSETKFREGVRSGSYVIDKTLTATGFSGIENIDWENIETHA